MRRTSQRRIPRPTASRLIAVTAAAALATGIALAGAAPADAARPLGPAATKQIAYAKKHWHHYNSKVYGDWNPLGGDCANFVSQTLIARGWKMDASWYNHGGTKASAAWTYVPAFDDYLAAHAKKFGLQRLSSSQRSRFRVGDIVVFSWEGVRGATDDRDHTEVIDRIIKRANGTYKIELASHNNDGEYRDLDHQITVEHPGGTFHVWHLTKASNR